MRDVGEILVENIRRFLKKNGLGQSDFASAIGSSESWVSRLLNSGNVNVELSTLVKIASALGVKPHELLQDSQSETDHLLMVLTALATQKGYDLVPAKKPKKPKITD